MSVRRPRRISWAGAVACAAVAAAALIACGAALAMAETTAAPEPTATAEPTATTEPTGTPEPTGTLVPSSTVEATPAPEPLYPAWMKRYWGRRVNRVVTTRRVVALTFDDGPNSLTDDFVRVLDRYGAKGTFFATGIRSRHAGMAAMNRYVLRHGHELANHTMHHSPLYYSYATDLREITTAERLLVRQTGKRTRWVRAMGGGINSTGLHATKDSKHLYAQWSVDSYDSHQRWLPPGVIYRNVIRSTHRGSIVLLHVTHFESLTALPMICRHLKADGYRMVTLSEMAALGRPNP